jgi:hypothetical protein
MAETSVLLVKFRDACINRGADGIAGIARIFHIVDKDRDKKLDLEEFITAVEQYGEYKIFNKILLKVKRFN